MGEYVSKEVAGSNPLPILGKEEKRMGTTEIVAVVGMLVSLIALLFTAKGSKRTDVKDLEARIAENTKLNIKLDSIGQDVAEIKEEIKLQRQEVQALAGKVATVEASSKQAHHRLDRFETELTVLNEKLEKMRG